MMVHGHHSSILHVVVELRLVRGGCISAIFAGSVCPASLPGIIVASWWCLGNLVATTCSRVICDSIEVDCLVLVLMGLLLVVKL